MFTVGRGYEILQPLSQFFTSQLINLEWVQPGAGAHQMFSAKSDVEDGAGHNLVTAYALKRPDGQWSLLVVNRDQQNAHRVGISFRNQSSGSEVSFAGPVEMSIFGKDQYQWRPAVTEFLAHAERSAAWSVVTNVPGKADPDGPIVHKTQNASANTRYDLPAASIVVIRGKVSSQ